MLRRIGPACAAALILVAGGGCGSRTQHAQARKPDHGGLSFTLERGTAASPTSPGISVVADLSAGTFATVHSAKIPRVVLADAVASFHGSGAPDLATHYNSSDDPDSCSEDSGVSVCPAWVSLWRAKPGGGFGRSRTVYEDDQNDISAVAGGDLDGDGRPDLAVAYSSYTGEEGVRLLSNRGAARFSRQRFLPTGQPPVALAVADLDGDGSPDLVTANSGDSESNAPGAGTVSVFLRRGAGFSARRDYRIGGGADGLAIGDLNGDSKLDVAVARGESGPFVSILMNRGDGTLAPKQDLRGARRNAFAVAIADLDGDGKSDLVTVNGGHGVAIRLNRGAGRFGGLRYYRTEGSPVALAVGDLNGDGRRDLAVPSASPVVSLLVNSGGR